MKPLLLLLVAAMLLPAATPQEEVTKCMHDLASAVLKNDKSALDRLLADDVVYSHSSGVADTKAKAIAGFETSKYTQYELKDGQTFQFYGKTAVVRGPLMITTSPGGKAQTLSLNVMCVWIKGGKGWQLVARQSTRLP